MPEIVIKDIDTAEGCAAVEALQIAVWGFDPLSVVPVHQLLTAAKNGGLVLGAYHGEQMVGFCYGFLGMKDGQVLLCSHMNAVLKEYRSQGIGLMLKLEQRRRCLERGIRLVTWTYDPLERVNATLNLHRLGAIARTYHVNLYGDLHDDLNKGMPTDRLIVEWNLDSERVRRRLGPSPQVTPPGPQAVVVKFPFNIQALKERDFSRALKWRLHLRQQLLEWFGKGYAAVDVLAVDKNNAAYVLEPYPPA